MSMHHPALLEAFICLRPRSPSSRHLVKLGAAYQLTHGSSSKFSLSSNPNGSMACSSEDLEDALLRLRQTRRQNTIGSIAKLSTTSTLIPSPRQPRGQFVVRFLFSLCSSTTTALVPPARHLARPPRQPSPIPPAAFHDVGQAPTDFKLVCSLNAAVSRGSSPPTADVPPYVKQTPFMVSTARYFDYQDPLSI
ncbi:uncharacterized protein TRAVEDRAFT_46415 [Trametes versicolor FP-101664 SS1]|uniref:uncharacterized protein n=1 Tax=Trametes versicolor (strain FP-101664) TaxID=717944 RepID=UPI0004621598|nr:uncharacterized protein TRAVEDRAFT_46415 [Trametes versicolor FP-101664 SS1]EIW59106.1 hypothetical protein TRAVEDRAFT_46415 [Trametes versicolor FP-101664 SS1]